MKVRTKERDQKEFFIVKIMSFSSTSSSPSSNNTTGGGGGPLVLVTGSSGHLGKALMLSLSSYGYTPIGIDILPGKTTTHVGSVSDEDFVKGLFARYDHAFEYVVHAASLHKPHVGSHSKKEFVRGNVEGTLLLLEESVKSERVKGFVYVSTTSAFGGVLVSEVGQKANWIDEGMIGAGMAKNVYGVTKEAAEGLAWLIAKEESKKKKGMAVVVLRTSRFFPEGDDAEKQELGDENLKVLELAYRRVDIADVVGACVCAMKKGQELKGGWGRYVISGPTPFLREGDDAKELGEGGKVGDVMERRVPGVQKVFRDKGWGWLSRLDRVYDSGLAEKELGWKAEYTFQRAVERVKEGKEWRSELSLRVGKLGYHAVSTGVYTQRGEVNT
ncbi:hypothetical protein QBC43DRAFT_6520 [Cladorrhinum sp. PSN259]|nr:hypothetical protein QBC43DRAFT_6520 [Cladorrhinum sp. PSN259]